MSEHLPIIKIPPDSLPPDVLVCGDPFRAELIAGMLDEAEERAWNREYRIFTGSSRGVPLAVCSHGVGAAGAAVCFELLIRAGARRLIRVGTAGSLSREIRDGALVIATGAVREEGVTRQLVPLSYPAVADMGVTRALQKAAAEQREFPVQSGIVLTLDAFFPALLDLPNNLMAKAGAVAVEMECAALLVVASLRGVQAGAILAIDGMAIDFDADAYNPHRDLVARAIEAEAGIAIRAVEILNGREGL
ncbi:MAG: nucleoside phosphorylase [Firmicutes bacterium]|nr:nucleoside phosphorylase [Bacillota bacterium]